MHDAQETTPFYLTVNEVPNFAENVREFAAMDSPRNREIVLRQCNEMRCLDGSGNRTQYPKYRRGRTLVRESEEQISLQQSMGTSLVNVKDMNYVGGGAFTPSIMPKVQI